MEITFNDMEISAIGEVSNISMGNAATALSLIVNREVDISVPVVKIKSKDEFVKSHKDEQVVVRVNYVKGLQGYSIFFIEERDVKVIADFMMGGDGSENGMMMQMDFSEMHLSAISEAMNQMMGSSATAMSTMLSHMVDISTPDAKKMSAGEYVAYEIPGDDKFVQITFDLKVGNVIVAEMIQAYPLKLAKAIADLFILKKQNDGVSA